MFSKPGPPNLGHLLRSQRELLDAHVGASGIPVGEFSWKMGDGSWTGYVDSEVPTLVHTASDFYFAFAFHEAFRDALLSVRDRGGHLVSYAPAKDRPAEVVTNLRWEEVVDRFMWWMSYLRRELGAPEPQVVSQRPISEERFKLPQQLSRMQKSQTVFVVHGRDERLRTDFFSFLRAMSIYPLEWADALKLTNKTAPYIGEVLEAAFSTAQAVLVLFSPDEEARLIPSLAGTNPDAGFQPRPNVLFEAGMAFSKDPDHTILIEAGLIRPFSDVAGRHVVRLDNSSRRRNELAQRLKTAGCAVSTVGADWLTVGDLTPSR